LRIERVIYAALKMAINIRLAVVAEMCTVQVTN